MYLFIITTLIGFLSVHSSSLTNLILKWFNRRSSRERELFREKINLKKEQLELSLAKDFVRHSKLQRKINALDQELQEIQSQRTDKFVFNIGFNYGVKILVGLIMLFLTVYYRKVPVFIVDLKYDLYPFTGFISFPNDYVNSVSVHFWMICCSSVAKLINVK